jgi:hypothetical protein
MGTALWFPVKIFPTKPINVDWLTKKWWVDHQLKNQH